MVVVVGRRRDHACRPARPGTPCRTARGAIRSISRGDCSRCGFGLRARRSARAARRRRAARAADLAAAGRGTNASGTRTRTGSRRHAERDRARAAARPSGHRLDRASLQSPRTRGRRGTRPLSPSSSSMRSSWLYFATRSLRAGAPVLIWPQLVATARSAIVVSSVSPLRCDITDVYAARVASVDGVERLGERADLVDLHEDRVGDAALDARARAARSW